MKWVTRDRPKLDRPWLLGTAKKTGVTETSND